MTVMIEIIPFDLFNIIVGYLDIRSFTLLSRTNKKVLQRVSLYEGYSSTNIIPLSCMLSFPKLKAECIDILHNTISHNTILHNTIFDRVRCSIVHSVQSLEGMLSSLLIYCPNELQIILYDDNSLNVTLSFNREKKRVLLHKISPESYKILSKSFRILDSIIYPHTYDIISHSLIKGNCDELFKHGNRLKTVILRHDCVVLIQNFYDYVLDAASTFIWDLVLTKNNRNAAMLLIDTLENKITWSRAQFIKLYITNDESKRLVDINKRSHFTITVFYHEIAFIAKCEKDYSRFVPDVINLFVIII